MGRYPDFLACPETIHIAVMPLAGRYFFSIDDLSMGNFYPPQHAISALDKDPAFDRSLTGRRIGDLAEKSPISRKRGLGPKQDHERQTQHTPKLHPNSDAKLPDGVGSQS